jgi:ABC-2 type transport system permease protein
MILLPQMRGVMAHRDVLRTLVKRDLRVRYARSVLGYVWTIIDPLAMAAIYFVVFTLIFGARKSGSQPYFLHLMIGMLAWQWFSQCLSETSRALLSEARLVRSTNVPRELWIVRVVIAKGIEYLLSLPVLAVITAGYLITGGTSLNRNLVFFPIAVMLTFLLSVGIGLILAPITVLVTDMARVVRILIRMGLYATPIIYSMHAAPDAIRRVLIFNPLSGIMEMLRAGFFSDEWSQHAAIVSVVATFVVLLIGMVVFRRLEPAVLKEI